MLTKIRKLKMTQRKNDKNHEENTKYMKKEYTQYNENYYVNYLYILSSKKITSISNPIQWSEMNARNLCNVTI